MKNRDSFSPILHISLWILQVLLAAGFIGAAAAKLFMPAAELAAMWPWTAAHPVLVKLTGFLDVWTGTGLVLPAALRIKPQLTVYAAYGTIALMLAAAAFHIQRGEARLIGINIVFALMAVCIAWGRKQCRHTAPHK